MTEIYTFAAHRKLSVAPMMDWTDRHCRYFHRLLSKNTLLYTEMINAGAVVHGDVPRHLRYNAEEHPVALQLGAANQTNWPPPRVWLKNGAMTRSISTAVARQSGCKRALLVLV